MTGDRHRELELVAELTLAKADLRMMTAIGKVQSGLDTIPPLIDKKIMDYDEKQARRRRWIINTIVASIGLALTAIALVASKWA